MRSKKLIRSQLLKYIITDENWFEKLYQNFGFFWLANPLEQALLPYYKNYKKSPCYDCKYISIWLAQYKVSKMRESITYPRSINKIHITQQINLFLTIFPLGNHFARITCYIRRNPSCLNIYTTINISILSVWICNWLPTSQCYKTSGVDKTITICIASGP